MPKHKLEIEYEYDFLLYGICCHEKDYRFVWHVNNALPGEFMKEEDILIREKTSAEPSPFSVFQYADEEMHTDYYIISNKSGSAYLVPEHKKADFLLMVKGELFEDQKESLIRKLKSISNVILAYEIDAASLRSKQHLIF